MWEHPLVRSILKILQLALLVALVALGIVFLPDDLIANIQQKVADAREFVQNEIVGRWPAISQDLDQKLDSTLAELGKWYQTAKEKFNSTVGNWVWEQLNGKTRQ